jgi:hypothetical protein
MRFKELTKLARKAYPEIGIDTIRALGMSFRPGASDAEQLKTAADTLEMEAARTRCLAARFVEACDAELAKLTAVVDRINKRRAN